MKKLVMKRGTGKTSRLIHAAEMTNGVIIVAYPAQKKIIIDKAKELGYDKAPYVTDVANFDEFKKTLRGFDIVALEHIYIDEADAVLKALFPQCKIEAITLSEED